MMEAGRSQGFRDRCYTLGMAILQALQPKTLTRSLAFAGLCLIVAGAAVLVWMFQFTNVNAAHPLKSSTEELDPAAQARIQQFVKATDAEKNYQVKTLDNEYFVSRNGRWARTHGLL